MSTVSFHLGDVFEWLAEIPDGSVDLVVTSPPYWRQRNYTDDPREIGGESSPAEFLATMLQLAGLWGRVLRDDGTMWVNLGDTLSGSGGAGGDHADDGKRAGQRRYAGSGKGTDTPPAKSVCWLPQLFGASLAYGRNLLTGEPCPQWVTRPPVTWCKPQVAPGRCDDRFRRATELIVWAAKTGHYYWDRPAILQPLADSPGNRYVRRVSETDAQRRRNGSTAVSIDNRITADYDPADSDGAPPLDWWAIRPSRGVKTDEGEHRATYPVELATLPILAASRVGGIVLDPFGGSGTTAVAAALAGRDCILIDLDERNLDLTRHRIAEAMCVVSEQRDGNTITWTVDAQLPGLKGEHPDQASLFAEEVAP